MKCIRRKMKAQIYKANFLKITCKRYKVLKIQNTLIQMKKLIQNKSSAVEKKPPPVPLPNNLIVNSKKKEETKKE